MRPEEEQTIIQARVRENQMKYWAPLAIAPIPYIAVSLYRNAKTPQQKQFLIGVGMIGVPLACYAGRVYLMNNSYNQSDYKKPMYNNVAPLFR